MKFKQTISKTTALVLAVCLIISCVAVSFSAFAQESYTVSANAPAIPIYVGKAVELSKLNIEIGGTYYPADELEWNSFSGNAAKKVGSQIIGLKEGNTGFTVSTAAGSQNVWVLVRPENDTEFALADIDFSNGFNANDWLQGSCVMGEDAAMSEAYSYKEPEVYQPAEAGLITGQYKKTASVMSNVQVNVAGEGIKGAVCIPAASKMGGVNAAVYKSEILKDFADYTVEAKMSNQMTTGDYTENMTAAPGLLIRTDANLKAENGQFILNSEEKTLSLKFRNYGGVSIFGLRSSDRIDKYTPYENIPLWRQAGYSVYTGGKKTDYFMCENKAKVFYPDAFSASALTVKDVKVTVKDTAIKYSLNNNVVFDAGKSTGKNYGAFFMRLGEGCTEDMAPMRYENADVSFETSLADYQAMYNQNIKAQKGTIGFTNNYGNDLYVYSIKVTLNDLKLPSMHEFEEDYAEGLPVNTRYNLAQEDKNTVWEDVITPEYQVKNNVLSIYAMPESKQITVKGTADGLPVSKTYDICEAGCTSFYNVTKFAEKEMIVTPSLTLPNYFTVSFKEGFEPDYSSLKVVNGGAQDALYVSKDGKSFDFTAFDVNKMIIKADMLTTEQNTGTIYTLGANIRTVNKVKDMRFLTRIPAIKKTAPGEGAFEEKLYIKEETGTPLNVGMLIIPTELLGDKELKIGDDIAQTFNPKTDDSIKINGYNAKNTCFENISAITENYADKYTVLHFPTTDPLKIKPADVSITAVSYIQYERENGSKGYAYSAGYFNSYNEIISEAHPIQSTDTDIDSGIVGGTNHDLDGLESTNDASYKLNEEITFSYHINGAYTAHWELSKDAPKDNLYGGETYTSGKNIVASGDTKSEERVLIVKTAMKKAGTVRLTVTLKDENGNNVICACPKGTAKFITAAAVDAENIKEPLEHADGLPSYYISNNGKVNQTVDEYITSIKIQFDSRAEKINAILEENKDAISKFVSSAVQSQSKTFGGVLKLTCFTISGNIRYFDFAIATNDTVGLTTTSASGLFDDDCYTLAASEIGLPEYNLRPATGYFGIPAGFSKIDTVAANFRKYGVEPTPRGQGSTTSITVNLNSHGYDNKSAYNSSYTNKLNQTSIFNGGIKDYLRNSNEETINNPSNTYAYGVAFRDYIAMQTGEKLAELLNGRLPVNVTTSGASFGGWQSVVVSALDYNVTRTTADSPWMCCINDAKSDDIKSEFGVSGDGIRYFSTVALAKYIANTSANRPTQYNIVINGGMGDYVAPLSGQLALYNAFCGHSFNRIISLYQFEGHINECVFSKETVSKYLTQQTEIINADIKVVTGGSVLRNRPDFIKPDNLMTTEQYHAELNNILSSASNFTDATPQMLKRLDNLDINLQKQIIYNTDDITECTGTKYYISEEGNDNNDGKSPETAWKTIKKLNTAGVNSGDLVLFRRGDVFRGVIEPKSGVSYSAYGVGYKPQICASYDAKQWNWVETGIANVWKLDHEFETDISSNYGLSFNDLNMAKDLYVSVLVSPDGSERAGYRCSSVASLTSNYRFCFRGPVYNEKTESAKLTKEKDNYIYMYCNEGNPGNLFTDIEIGMNSCVFNENNRYLENVEINNLELLYGRGPIWTGNSKNIEVTYCIAGWSGGFADTAGGTPYSGGGGVWGSCDNFVWDHCYIFQQWDSGVSPQYKTDKANDPAVTFKDFITTNCLFKGCRWTCEYWLSDKTSTEDIIDHMVFDYNICRDGGYGFNPNRSDSRYVQNWGYESSCYNSSISHNVFDRPNDYTYEIGGFEQLEPGENGTAPVDKFSIDRMPKMEGNIHLQTKNKNFAHIHKGCEYLSSSYDLRYRYTETDLKKYIAQGFETDSLYLFASR